MKKYRKNLILALVCFLIVIVLNFFLPRLLPGNPIAYLTGFSEEVRDGSMMHPDTRRELLYVLTMLRDRGEKETFRFLREVVLAGKPFAVPAQ